MSTQQSLLDLMRRDVTLSARTQVRRDDPSTSHEAASRSRRSATRSHERVIALLVQAPLGLTDAALLVRWREQFGAVPESTPRKRRHDLVRMGVVTKQHDRDGVVVKRVVDGSRRIVWTLVFDSSSRIR